MPPRLPITVFAFHLALALLTPERALAGDLPDFPSAAGACAERVDGWLSCTASSSPDVLDCACAVSTTRDAWFVKVDASTTTSTSDGRLLVVRDLTSEQNAVGVRIWIDDRADAEDLAAIYGAFLAEYDAALDDGLPADLAAETAAERGIGDTGTHEVGHWLGLHHTH